MMGKLLILIAMNALAFTNASDYRQTGSVPFQSNARQFQTDPYPSQQLRFPQEQQRLQQQQQQQQQQQVWPQQQQQIWQQPPTRYIVDGQGNAFDQYGRYLGPIMSILQPLAAAYGTFQSGMNAVKQGVQNQIAEGCNNCGQCAQCLQKMVSPCNGNCGSAQNPSYYSGPLGQMQQSIASKPSAGGVYSQNPGSVYSSGGYGDGAQDQEAFGTASARSPSAASASAPGGKNIKTPNPASAPSGNDST